MAVKLNTKQKSKTSKAKVNLTTSKSGIEEATEMVSEMVALNKDLQVLNAKAAKITQKLNPMREKVRDLVDPELSDDEKISLVNEDGEIIEVSAKGNSRVIKDVDDVVIALEEIEEGLALKLAQFKLGDLDKYLSKSEQKTLLDVQRTNRTVTVK